MAQSSLVQAASRAEMVQRPRSMKVTSCIRIQENKRDYALNVSPR